MKLKLDDSAYPERLLQLPSPPPILTTSGLLERGPRGVIAIVGSRNAGDEALVFAHALAFQLARAGVVVISGGAIGIDGAAHRGALAAGGTTWVVSPTGKDRLYPPQHQALFAEVASSNRSRMLWPFADRCGQTRHSLRYRNGVLASLCDALVVVQAHYQSGSRNAAGWARDLKRPVWAVPAAPWMTPFCGSTMELAEGKALPLWSSATLFTALGLGEPAQPPAVDPATLFSGASGRNDGPAPPPTPFLAAPPKPPATEPWSTDEKLLFSALLPRPMHTDEILARTTLPIGAALTALLTLTLKDVVVEGPSGFFRRSSGA